MPGVLLSLLCEGVPRCSILITVAWCWLQCSHWVWKTDYSHCVCIEPFSRLWAIPVLPAFLLFRLNKPSLLSLPWQIVSATPRTVLLELGSPPFLCNILDELCPKLDPAEVWAELGRAEALLPLLQVTLLPRLSCLSFFSAI